MIKNLKYLFSFVLILLLGLSIKSQDHYVDGYVIVDGMFLPVEDQIVDIRDQNGGLISSVLTDESGYFQYELDVNEGDEYITLSLVRQCTGQINTYETDLDLDRVHLCYIFEVCEDIPCEARFNYEKQAPNNLIFQFTDVSLFDAYAWSWDFGDGATSTQKNPTHEYDLQGDYLVSLTITGENCTAQTQRMLIANYQSCLAKFSFEQVNQGEQLVMNFSNNSMGYFDGRFWEFGDDSFSSEQNPKHAYLNPGQYDVELTLFSQTCFSSLQKVVYVAPSPECFALFNHEQILSSDLLVQFEDKSAGKSLLFWYWEFGDGFNAEGQNPAHIYQDTGTYEVSLRVISTSGQSYYTQIVHVFESSGCIADFTWVQPDPDNPQIVFNSLTPNGDLIFNWDFGDGETSNLKSPAHQFDDFGSYKVTLDVLGYGCGDNKSETVVLEEPFYCDAKFTWSQAYPQSRAINFINQSFGNGISYVWDFGDGQSSDVENPVHTYDTFGQYSVQLIINTTEGCSDTTHGTIEILPPLNLSGFVYAGENPISLGNAFLYRVIGRDEVQFMGECPLADGFYEFRELAPGDYFVQAVPVYDFPNPVIPFYSPVYSGGETKWQNAAVINTESLPQDVNLNLNAFNGFFTGKGSVAGRVSKTGEPDNFPLIFYLTDGDDEIYRFVVAEPDMQFSFDDIPFGSYSLIPEKAGKESESFDLLIDQDSPDIRDIVFLETNATIKPDLSTIQNVSLNRGLHIYPNPANEIITITIPNNRDQAFELKIFDASTMQRVYSQKTISGERVKISALAQGIYVLEVNFGQHSYHQKLVINR